MVKQIEEGSIIGSWEVLRAVKKNREYFYTCRCLRCSEEQQIGRSRLLKKEVLCKKCGFENLVKLNLETITRNYNRDLNKEFNQIEIIKHPKRKYWFICLKGHNYRGTIRNFLLKNCPSCTPTINSNKLLTKSQEKKFLFFKGEIEKFYEDDGKIEDMLNPNLPKKVFRCEQGHKFSIDAIDLVKGKWCPFCSREQYVMIVLLEIKKFIKDIGIEVLNSKGNFKKLINDRTEVILQLDKNTIIVEFFLKGFGRVLQKNEVIKMKHNKEETLRSIQFFLDGNLEKDVDSLKKLVLKLS